MGAGQAAAILQRRATPEERAEFERDLPVLLDAMDLPTTDGINAWFVAKAAHEAGTLCWGPQASFLAFRMLDERPFRADPQCAARTQLWNLRTRDPMLHNGTASGGLFADRVSAAIAAHGPIGLETAKELRLGKSAGEVT